MKIYLFFFIICVYRFNSYLFFSFILFGFMVILILFALILWLKLVIMFGIIGLWIISTFVGDVLMCLICPTPSVISLPCYLQFLTLFVVFICG